jgi:hypothetical protein
MYWYLPKFESESISGLPGALEMVADNNDKSLAVRSIRKARSVRYSTASLN